MECWRRLRSSRAVSHCTKRRPSRLENFIPLLLENYDDRGITPPPRRSEFYRKSELQGTEALFYSTPTTHRLSASAGVCLFISTLRETVSTTRSLLYQRLGASATFLVTTAGGFLSLWSHRSSRRLVDTLRCSTSQPTSQPICSRNLPLCLELPATPSWYPLCRDLGLKVRRDSEEKESRNFWKNLRSWRQLVA